VINLQSKLLKRASDYYTPLLERAIKRGSVKSIVTLAYKLDNELRYGCESIWSEINDDLREMAGDLLIAQGALLGASLKKNKWGSIPWLIAPSVLGNIQDSGLKFPIEAFKTCPISVCIDEYFGLCYQPERKIRFSSNAKPLLIQRIHQEYSTIQALFGSYNGGGGALANGICVADLHSLIAIYGQDQIAHWDTYESDLSPIEETMGCDLRSIEEEIQALQHID
jgi:hypothetical protein